MKPIFVITTPRLELYDTKALEEVLKPIREDYHIVCVTDHNADKVTCQVLGMSFWFWLTHLFTKKPKLPL